MTETDTDLAAGVRTLCQTVETMLGPFGANKLVIEDSGNVTATAAPIELLDRLDIEDPALTLLETAARDFKSQHGDGTALLVTLTGALLREAESLTEKGVHPTAVSGGFRAARDRAIETLELNTYPLAEFDAETVAKTALTGTRNLSLREIIAEYIAEATARAGDAAGDSTTILFKDGGSPSETDLISGVVIDKGTVLDTMPREYAGNIAVLSGSVDVPHAGSQMGPVTRRVIADVDSYDERAALGEQETSQFNDQLRDALSIGCGAIFTESAVNDRVQATLAAQNMLAVHRVDREQLDSVASVTGANVVPSLSQVEAGTLGQGRVDIQRKAGQDVAIITGTEDPAVQTLFCRAPDVRSVTAFNQSIEAALAATVTAYSTGQVVAGGGAIETAIAQEIDDFAYELRGREQLAAQAFSRALMIVPQLLGRTAGMDGTRTAVQLRAAHTEGRSATGVDVLAGNTRDVLESDPLIEPAELKRAIIINATDIVTQLIRIDAQLPATELADENIDPPEDVDMPEQG